MASCTRRLKRNTTVDPIGRVSCSYSVLETQVVESFSRRLSVFSVGWHMSDNEARHIALARPAEAG